MRRRAGISSPTPAKQIGLTQKDLAAALGVSIARISQIEHGDVTSFEVIGRYVEALGGRLALVADFGDRQPGWLLCHARDHEAIPDAAGLRAVEVSEPRG